LSTHYPKTEKTPYAAADAYLQQARGLDIAPLKGVYIESSYHTKGLGSATVKFTLPNGAYWERIIDNPQRFDRKANFFGSYKGYWWRLPQQDLTKATEIWLTEGIFDAISLVQNGLYAVSLMSCHNYPEHALAALKTAVGANKKPLLVWALDKGNAGEKAIRKHVARSQQEGWKSCAALPSQFKNEDWNDLHLKDRLERYDLMRYRYYGDLLLTKSATDKAMLIFNYTHRNNFYFQFDSRFYWFKLDIERHLKAVERILDSEKLTKEEATTKALKESGAVNEIANCYPTPLYFQKSEETDESWYYLKLDFPQKRPDVKATFTASQLTSASEFKKRLLHVAKGAVYTGDTHQLDRFCKNELPHIKEVKTQNFMGYNKALGVYVFNDIAVQNGKLYTLNEEDYFLLEHLDIKTLSSSPRLEINHELRDFDVQWLDDLWLAFGVKGYTLLAFWLGSLFAEQIRKLSKSYPFLEIIGEPGSGKSTLIEFFWRLTGRTDYEGFDPSKSTLVGRARNFAQVSNLPVCLIESDRMQDNIKRAFDWEEMKSLYNGRATRSTGIKTNQNETYEPLFKGSIIIAQNSSVEASRAVLERIIHLHTDKSGQSEQTRQAAIRLERYPIEQLSGFLPKALLSENAIVTAYETSLDEVQRQLFDDEAIGHERIAKNHAQLIVLLRTLSCFLPIKESRIAETETFIVELAKERVKSLEADNSLVTEFWDMFDYLNQNALNGVNHSNEENIYAVNFNHLAQVASEYRQNMPNLSEIKSLLKMGKRRRFVGIKTVRSYVNNQYNQALPTLSAMKKPDVVKCWVFETNY